jgi:hypothetical protein
MYFLKITDSYHYVFKTSFFEQAEIYPYLDKKITLLKAESLILL